MVHAQSKFKLHRNRDAFFMKSGIEGRFVVKLIYLEGLWIKKIKLRG